MKKTINMLLGLLLLAAVPAAFAQATGTITINGTVPDAFAITNTSDAALSATVALGTLTPATGGALTSGTVQARLRSNKAYTLSAQASALTFVGAGAADGGSDITLADIGFGITAIDTTGANVVGGAGRDTIVALYGFDPSTKPVVNGLTPFVAGTDGTLNDISAASTLILSGRRISVKGNNSTNNNFALVTFGVATLPQYFTPNSSFSTVITLTMATP